MITEFRSWVAKVRNAAVALDLRHSSVTARLAGTMLIIVFAVCAVVFELRSSWLEAHVLAAVAQRATFSVDPGPSGSIDRPARGPYDQRLGLAESPRFVRRLESHGYRVQYQAQDSKISVSLSHLGVFPIYHEKNQAGLLIRGRDGRTLYNAAYPRQIYLDFESIPHLVVNTLLFIENREILDRKHPYRNPAIQWGRLSRALSDLGLHTLDHRAPVIGGSTLETQLEKTRHSPQGRTESVAEKLRQMVSASLRAYQDGPVTYRARREIICNYINSIPLAARHGQGEVIGLADGLNQWYGADFDEVNQVLNANERSLGNRQFVKRAQAYREVLSLLLALREPTRELAHNVMALNAETDRYLVALGRSGVISGRLRDAALRVPVVLQRDEPTRAEQFTALKGPNAIRMELLRLLGVDSTYALDRLDLTVRTTLDGEADKSVTKFLDGLSTVDAVKAAGLDQFQLLNLGSPKAVIYSVTLYERARGANVLRIQTDNYNQPLDISRGTRLQLGSTAKLRTLINYLQIIEKLHDKYAALPLTALQSAPVTPGDNLTHWALAYLSTAKDRTLEPMLEAALQRKYSGNPGEAFFTAGGLQHFANFERSEDGQVMTVSEGFQRSVNLVFIRLMRDIEHYYMDRLPGADPTILTDPANPARKRYLERFADFEGGTFLRRFYAKYTGLPPTQALQKLVAGRPLTAVRTAVIFRSVRPQADLEAFTVFLRAHLPASVLSREDPAELYCKYGPDKFDLNDRGYLAHIHPLELWLLRYREQHPNATLHDVLAASAPERQEVYRWMFKTRYKHAQDRRIETLLEIDAFQQIHRAWQQLGYPFASLTPSYATCIGVSGDTPQALAELAGILVNDGIRYPSVKIQQLEFARATPFAAALAPDVSHGVRVLSPVIARLVRQEMIGVVENGTGRRANGGIKLANGSVLPVGGKTGTGDNRLQEFGAHGGIIASKVVSRTAAFVFFIGDRYFGTILAFVPGRTASNYGFTSALAVQILKDLEPRLSQLLSRRDLVSPLGDSTVSHVAAHPHLSNVPKQLSIRRFSNVVLAEDAAA